MLLENKYYEIKNIETTTSENIFHIRLIQDCDVYNGHFPGNPIMPGVLIVESLAQTGAVAILSLEENKGKNALFGGIDKMKFKKQVVPGDKLKLEVKIIKRKGPIGIGEAVATFGEKIVARGELTFAVV